MNRASRSLWRITRMVMIVFSVRAVFDLSIALFGHPATWALSGAVVVGLSLIDD